MARIVEDEELLKQLENPKVPSEVTDPKLLAQLNAPEAEKPVVKNTVLDAQKLIGTPVAAGTPTGVEQMGSKNPAAGIVGLAEAFPAMVTGAPSWFVSTISTPGNAVINWFRGSDKPFHEAVEETDEFLSQFTYQPHTSEGKKATKGLTYGAVAATAPYLLPFLGVGEALDSKMAQMPFLMNRLPNLKWQITCLCSECQQQKRQLVITKPEVT